METMVQPRGATAPRGFFVRGAYAPRGVMLAGCEAEAASSRYRGQHVVMSLPQGGEGEVGGKPGPEGGGDEAGDGEGEEEAGEPEEDDPEGAEGVSA